MSEVPVDHILSLARQAFENEPPLLPAEELHGYIEAHLARADSFLQAVRANGSPLYLVDKEALCRRAREFTAAFEDALTIPVRPYYAIKSNNHPVIAETMLQCGLGLDVSSGVELEMALGLGANDMIFSGPGKTDAELSLAVRNAGRVTVLMDSFAELSRLENIAAEHEVVVRAGLRLTTNPKGMWRKFGIPQSRLLEFFSAAQACRHIQLCGLQFHSSWNLGPESQAAVIAELGQTLRTLRPEWLSRLRFVDIGGGYWPPRGEWLQSDGTTAGAIRNLLAPGSNPHDRRHRLPVSPIRHFAEALGQAVERHLRIISDLTIYLEPGRWLCNDAMHFLMTVVDRKAPDLVITDAGGNAIGWERYETDFFPVLNLTRPAMEEHPCDVHGCLCTPHDVWGYSYWGKDIQPGDVLLIPTQGAYTYSLRQEFIKPIPNSAVLAPGPMKEGTPG
jgi:diaminopimelate decarboxylase